MNENQKRLSIVVEEIGKTLPIAFVLMKCEELAAYGLICKERFSFRMK